MTDTPGDSATTPARAEDQIVFHETPDRKYQPLPLTADETWTVLCAVETWAHICADAAEPADMKEERDRYRVMREACSTLRTRIIEHYGHRMTGPGTGWVDAADL